jgi:hypothetical protein
MRPPSPIRLLPLLAILVAAGLVAGCSGSDVEPATSAPAPGATAPVAPAT